MNPSPTIGILALQGDFAEHQRMFARFGVATMLVKRADELLQVDALVIPGGESTVIGKLAAQYGLIEPIRAFAAAGKPIWGTCAGLIFLAKEVGRDQPLLGLLDITVERNAFGRQLDSFEQTIPIPLVNEAIGESEDIPCEAVFIRAPVVSRVGEGVTILAKLEDGKVIAVRQRNLLGTAFHPELTEDTRWHRYFLSFSGL